MVQILHASTQRHLERNGPKRYIRIMLFQYTDELRKYSQEKRPGGNWDWPVGAFFPPSSVFKFRGGKLVNVDDEHWGGLMLLSMEHLTNQVVIHETVHAACFIYRQDFDATGDIKETCTENEEALAYIIGDLSEQVLLSLSKAGYYVRLD